MLNAKYIGPRPDLKDKTAKVQTTQDGTVMAQFDDIATGYGYGWHSFAAQDFEPVEAVADGELA